MKNGRTGLHIAIPYLLPSIIGAVLFSLLPILISFFLSLTDWTGMTPVSLTNGFFTFVKDNFYGMGNYLDILKDGEFWRTISHNFYFIILYLPLMLVLSMGCALIAGSSRKFSGTLRNLYYIPVLTSWVAGALVWKWIFSPTYGPINNFLALFGIDGPLWLQSETWAMPSIVIASVWKDMGFYGMIILGGLKAINVEYYEAAKIDGASAFQSFIRITLPLLSSVIFYVLMLSLINAFQLFPQIMVMTDKGNAGPNGATMVMGERIYKYAFRYGKMGYAAAYSWILFLIIMNFTSIQKIGEKRWVHYDV